GGVVKKSLIAVGHIDEAGGVSEQSEASSGCVSEADSVAEKRSRPNGRTIGCGVRIQCSSADRRVEPAAGVGSSREESNCRVELAAAEIQKCAVSFRGIKTRITSVWCWINRLHLR